MRLVRDIRAAAALEFALTFPVVLLFVVGLFAAFSLICCKRAMDVGVEKALRSAMVNSAGGASAAQAQCTYWAGVLWGDVGRRGSCVVTPATFVVGGTVTATYTYNWAAPALLNQPDANSIFNAATLTATAKITVMN